MATSLDNVLLDTSYSNDASGGPEFATAVIRAGNGGSVASRNENREDYISRYEITFGMLSKIRRKLLREFAVLRRGMARGFRFLPPDNFEFSRETAGILNPATAEISVMNATNGTIKEFFVIENYADSVTSYLRWLICPSPLDDVLIEIFAANNLAAPAVTGSFPGGFIYTPDGPKLPVSRGITLPTFGRVHLYYRAGRLIFASNVPSGYVIKLSGVFHVPVSFSEDWQKFSVDDGGLAEYKVSLEEILPVELGLSPDVTLAGDITSPVVTLDFQAGEPVDNSGSRYVLTDSSGSAVTDSSGNPVIASF